MGGLHNGRVVVSYGRDVVVEDAAGPPFIRCVMRGGRAQRAVCGDYVHYQSTGDRTGVIERIEARTGVIERGDFRGRPRPLAAHVDRLVVVSAEPPGLDGLLLDRYVVLARHVGLETELIVNKADRLEAAARERLCRALATRAAALGTRVGFASTVDKEGLDALRARLEHGTSVLAGASGVGKSSLIQALVPELDLRIAAVSAATGQGRHTTTATTLFRVPGGGALIDSPGVRTLRLDHIPPETVLDAYPEVARHLGGCRFNDCRHEHEPGCAVTVARERGEITPERFASLRTLLAESRSQRRQS